MTKARSIIPVPRVGVVGVGHLGYHHARNFAAQTASEAVEGAELVGVVDIDRNRAARAAADFCVPWFASVADLVAEGVDAVSVAVPTACHHEVTLELLEAGVDVLVEKPIARSIEEAGAMVAAATAQGRILQVGHIERFNGAVIALLDAFRPNVPFGSSERDVRRNPRFIECHRLSPYPSRGDDVSVVLDLMIHDLEIVRALVGMEVISVDAVGVPVFSMFEDIANARLRFASGCVANLTCSRVSMERMRKIRVFAADAYVSTDYAAQQVLVYRKKGGPLEAGQSPMDLISVDSLPVRRDEPLKLELASFIECVRERTRPVVSGEDGLAALELAFWVVRSIRGEA